MSMHLRVTHKTGYVYSGGVVASYNEARMTPVTTAEQYVLHSRIDVSPTPWTYTYPDYWGTQVTAFEVHELHNELNVTSTSTVDVSRSAPSPGGMSWDALRGAGPRDEFVEYLQMSPWVRPPADLADTVEGLAAKAATPTELAYEVCEMVHGTIRYDGGSTVVTTTAADAWSAKAGVCQDLAHLTIGALRHVGVPARYVSGYLHPRRDPEVGEPVAGESHAWIEWWDGEWIGFDPTNDAEPGDRHIVVGHGRSYRDVTPLRGIYSGGQTSGMEASVTITLLR
ncbi:MAG: transglutaminase family protein [Nocardioidaceae bacterium]